MLLKQCRKQKGISQAELASKLGVTQPVSYTHLEEEGRDARRGECDLLDEAEAGAAQDGKAVEHRGRCGSQQQEIPGLSRRCV